MTYDAWDYGPGNMSAADAYALQRASSSGGSGYAWANALTSLAGVYMQTEAQKTAIKAQVAADGRRYVEGQPYGNVPQGGGLVLTPGFLLLIGLGALAFVAAKD